MSSLSHRVRFFERCATWALGFVERWIIPALPRGLLRQRLRASIDRAQARLHSRVHEHSDSR